MKILHVICNPAARRGHAAETYRMVRAWANGRNDVTLALHMTATATDATEITKQLTNTNKDVYLLVIGGDGTINEVVNGIVNFEHTYIMILPFGSGNDFIFTLGLKEYKNPADLMNLYMKNAYIKKTNYLLINNKYRSINSIGLGMSAETIKYRNKLKLFSPKFQYMFAIIRKSLFYKNFTYWVSFDNKPEVKIVTMWFVANNGKRLGGQVMATPDAILDDDYFDVMYMDKFPRIKLFGILSKVNSGKIKEIKYCHMQKCKEINVILKNNCVEYDGNLLDNLNVLNVKVGDEKVNFILPVETNNDSRTKK